MQPDHADWLVNRLTPGKQQSARWVAFARALEEYHLPLFSKVEQMREDRSLFNSSMEALEERLSEYGDFFDILFPLDDSTKRLSVMWRRRGIHRKETDLLIRDVLKTYFKGLNVEWLPVWCPLDKPYSHAHFVTKQLKPNLDENAHFLTSRGRLGVDAIKAHSLGISMVDLATVAFREIEKVRPARVVYDGVAFNAESDFRDGVSITATAMTVITSTASIGITRPELNIEVGVAATATIYQTLLECHA